MLIAIIFAVSYLRTHFNTEKVRVYLQGKSEFTGNVLANNPFAPLIAVLAGIPMYSYDGYYST